MSKSKVFLPLWPKLVLGLLLFLFLLGGALVLFFNLQSRNAEVQGTLPSLNGYRYVAINDGRFGEKYANGSLLLLRPKPVYQPGDEIVASRQSAKNPQLLLHRRYLLLQLQAVSKLQASGAPIGMPEQLPISVSTKDIVGSVTHIVPHWGAVYSLILSVPGFLFFSALPLALAIAWGVGLLLASIHRRSAFEKQFFSERGQAPEPSWAEEFAAAPPEYRFDLFAEEPFYPSAAPEHEASEQSRAVASPFMNPLAKRGAPAPAPDSPGEPPEPSEPPEPPLEATPLQAPKVLAPRPSGVEEEAVAIYSGEGETAGLEPKYLHQELSGSLAELKASLRASRRTARVVDIVVGDQAAGLDADKLRRLNAFDPDRAIAEIKRKNALFEQSFLSGEPIKPAEPPVPKEEKPPYPSRSAEEFYQIQPTRHPDKRERRPPAPMISVVEEEPSFPDRFHNRNGEDQS